MNRQPYCKPPRSWNPRLTPAFVRISRGYRRRQLTHQQKIGAIDVQNVEVLRALTEEGAGILITPNHSAHYDAPALYAAADAIDCPLYFMTAWQVFAMSSRWEQWAMQRLGCFSVDREGTDRQAFKQAVQVLQQENCPLVIFPEGDIYHTTDFVTPFREGAAAIALSAAKRADRKIVVVPCGIKFWYIDDPLSELTAATALLERRLFLRSESSQKLADRIHRLAEAALALKELDYLGHTRSGRLRDRVRHLESCVLADLEARHGLTQSEDLTPARVKVLRQHVIQRLEETNGQEQGELVRDMEDLFFIMQLYSYRGDYLADNPSIERLAETVDKFEEDILNLDYPTVRGSRRVCVRFGEPITLPSAGEQRPPAAQLTQQLEDRVQSLIDELNAQSPMPTSSDNMRV